MRVLFVTKDKGPFNVTCGVVPELRARGHHVSVIAEGLSAGLWKAAGETLAFEGTVDFTKEPFTLNVANTLSDLTPDLLVTTGSVPINLEARFAAAAKERGIRVVAIDDTVGSATRLKVAPDLVLTLNWLAVDFYQTQGVLDGVPKEPIGSDYFRKIVLSADKRNEVSALRRQKDILVLYSGQGRFPMTGEILDMTIQSILRTPQERHVGLIVRHHPKKLPNGAMVSIDAQLENLERQRPGTVINSTLTSDEAASVCDFTFTCFGSALNFSAVHSRIPVCVMTPACAQDLLEQTGFGNTPLAAMGAALAWTKPCALGHEDKSFLAEQQRKYAQPNPFDPRAAADKIERLLSSK